MTINMQLLYFITTVTSQVHSARHHQRAGYSALPSVQFFQPCKITGQHTVGLLSDISEDKRERGFLAFLRLIGTLYFKKHISAMASLKKKLKHHNSCLILLKSHASKQNMRLGITPGIMSERISDERVKSTIKYSNVVSLAPLLLGGTHVGQFITSKYSRGLTSTRNLWLE